MPNDSPDMGKNPNMPLSMGEKIATFKEAFEATGYKVEDVTKIVVTHKHPDHTGELRMFPNAKIYISEREADDMKLTGDNIVRVKFTDGAFKNFPECQRITDTLVMVKAEGHTNGNSVSILEDKENDCYYMFHGDVTYCDAALLADELSVVFEDKAAARETLDRVREFIKNNPTVYCGTHTPQGYENLEAKRVMDLDNPPETIWPEIKFEEKQSSGKYICSICGYVYDPAEHDGVAFEDLPDDWVCPRCKQPKSKFNKA